MIYISSKDRDLYLKEGHPFFQKTRERRRGEDGGEQELRVQTGRKDLVGLGHAEDLPATHLDPDSDHSASNHGDNADEETTGTRREGKVRQLIVVINKLPSHN